MSGIESHPSAEQLRNFHCGKLRGLEAETIERHLADCARCLALLQSEPDDPIVLLARGASLAAVATPATPASAARTATHPASAAIAEPPPAVPPELVNHPRYKVLQLLGHGGMGAVYLAEHLKMERKVALKVIRPALLSSPSAFPRFQQEVKAAARLSHPNIVQAFDADQAGDLHFLVMEYVEGTDLSQLLRNHGPLPVAEACEYTRQAALGLQHAHEQGMVHRDIKPHNLMLAPKGVVKILDFGLAGLAQSTAPDTTAEDTGDTPGPDSQLTAPGSVMGTADYMAPEQTRNPHAVDSRADLYSLGCTLYQLLSGRVPFERGSMADKMVRHAVDAPPSLREAGRELPAGLIRLVEKMMAKKPEERYQCPAEVAAALLPFAQPGPSAIRKPRRRLRWVVAGVFALAVAACAFAVYRHLTNHGTVVVNGDELQGEIVITRDGQEVAVIDTATTSTLRLPTGEYGIAARNPAELTVTPDTLSIRRGEETAVAAARAKPSGVEKITFTLPRMKPTNRGKAILAQSAAQDAYGIGDYTTAITRATEALAEDDSLTAARVTRGRSLASQGNWSAAIVDLDEAIRRSPKDGLAYMIRGWVLLNLYRFHDAIEDCDRAAELGQTFPIRLANRGYCYAMLGHYEAALADYNEYLNHTPADARGYWTRASIHERLGNAEAAAADFREAIQRAPDIKSQSRSFMAFPPPGLYVIGRYDGLPLGREFWQPMELPRTIRVRCDPKTRPQVEFRDPITSTAVWVRPFGPSSGATLATITPDYRQGLVANADDRVWICDLHDGRLVYTTERLGLVTEFLFSPDGGTVAIVTAKSVLVVRLPGRK